MSMGVKFIIWLFRVLTDKNARNEWWVGCPFILPTGALVAASAIGAAGSIVSSSMSDDGGQPEFDYKQLAGYEESDWAREKMQERLQDWGGQEGYGAIDPDWDEIWKSAKDKVSRYYWGDVGGTGLAGKVKASAARRGVSESPATETLLTRMGQKEGQQLSDIAVEQSTLEATMGEQARQNWFGQMQGLASMKPAYATPTGVTEGEGTGELVSSLGSTVGSAIQQNQQNKWMENYMKELMGKNDLGIDPVGSYPSPSGGRPAASYPGGYSSMGGL